MKGGSAVGILQTDGSVEYGFYDVFHDRQAETPRDHAGFVVDLGRETRGEDFFPLFWWDSGAVILHQKMTGSVSGIFPNRDTSLGRNRFHGVADQIVQNGQQIVWVAKLDPVAALKR